MILGNIITSIIGPFATVFGYVLAAFYSFTHSYGLSIVLLTLSTMVVVFPLTRKGTRSMMQMQLLQPELLAMRNKYKKTPGMSAEEKRDMARGQQEEMMAFYRENGVSPTGGCLPLFLQFPVFIVLYNVIRGMTHTVTVGTGKAATVLFQPLYIQKKSTLYTSLVAAHGKMGFLGFNLTDSLRSHPGVSGFGVTPYVLVILIAVALQYVSIWQITNRNAGQSINPQMQAVQKFMPLIFVVIYIAFPAGVGLYFIISSLFRIGQQEWMYKRDPVITKAMTELRERKANAPPEPPGAKKGFFQSLRDAAGTSSLDPAPASKGGAGKAASRPARPAGQRPRTAQQPRSGQKRAPSVEGTERSTEGSTPREGTAKPAQRPGQRPGQRPARPAGQGQGNRPSVPSSRTGQAPRERSESGDATRNPTAQRRPPNGVRPAGNRTAPSGKRSAPSSGKSNGNANGARDGAPRDGAPRDGAPRDGAPRARRAESEAARTEGPRKRPPGSPARPGNRPVAEGRPVAGDRADGAAADDAIGASGTLRRFRRPR